MSRNKQQVKVKCPVRLMLGEDIAIGPGKVQLLAAIQASGSIAGAARELGMSYRRAWLLVETMNQCFTSPLVETATGGKAGGGAQLSENGRIVVQAYENMIAEIDEIARMHLRRLLQEVPLRGTPTLP